MKLLMTVWLLLFVTHLSAGSFGLGVGGYNLTTTAQKDEDGERATFSFAPGVSLSGVWNIGGGHFFNPDFGYVHYFSAESSYLTALMHYTISGKTQKYLTQDDIDGITYLYPNEKKLEGLGGSCGTIARLGDNDNFGQGPGMMLANIFLGFLLMIIARFLSVRLKAITKRFQIKPNLI